MKGLKGPRNTKVFSKTMTVKGIEQIYIYIYSYVKIRHMKDSEGKPANRETVGSINR